MPFTEKFETVLSEKNNTTENSSNSSITESDESIESKHERRNVQATNCIVEPSNEEKSEVREISKSNDGKLTGTKLSDSKKQNNETVKSKTSSNSNESNPLVQPDLSGDNVKATEQACSSKQKISDKEVVYWMDYNKSTLDPEVTLSFHKGDILPRPLKPFDCERLLTSRYGKRSEKIHKIELHAIVEKKHDIFRNRFKAEIKSGLENAWVSIAMLIGMRDGRNRYGYSHIVKHVLDNPTYSTICRLQYLTRGVFDAHSNWKLKLEKTVMRKLKFVYDDGFCSSPTENGCFLTLVSDLITQKHRDINRRLQKKTFVYSSTKID